jgi:hypothetical protein
MLTAYRLRHVALSRLERLIWLSYRETHTGMPLFLRLTRPVAIIVSTTSDVRRIPHIGTVFVLSQT